VAEEEEKQEEEKFDFTREGEVVAYISQDQAGVLAVRTARETPGAYGRRWRRATMVFEVSDTNETEDHYVVTLSFRPEGVFSGTPGQEQFFIDKTGRVEVRQVLDLPAPNGHETLPRHSHCGGPGGVGGGGGGRGGAAHRRVGRQRQRTNAGCRGGAHRYSDPNPASRDSNQGARGGRGCSADPVSYAGAHRHA